MNLREKYGQWGVILGATEGVGKAFCEKLAQGGMNVVMVGRREEKLQALGQLFAECLADTLGCTQNDAPLAVFFS